MSNMKDIHALATLNTDHYLDTLLWSSGEEWDEYETDQVADRDLVTLDIAQFLALPGVLDDLLMLVATGQATWPAHMHDYALTRNHHGAGYWDRGYGAAGDRLTTAAESMGEVGPVIGDDGAIYIE